MKNSARMILIFHDLDIVEVNKYSLGEAYIEVRDVGATSLMILGLQSSTPLPGVTTLELLGLEVDPTTGTLKPMELLLLKIKELF